MYIVLITALGVGGATVFGTVIGFIFKNLSMKFSDAVLGFAAGVMLIAAIKGLILPSLECGGAFALPLAVLGIFSGAALIVALNKLVPHINTLVSKAGGKSESAKNKILIFVLAIAIHNLPEGIAAGVGFGTGDFSGAVTVALGIALQNVPEGMVIVSPMLSAGISPKRTFLYASLTGCIEVVGTFVGYFAVSLSSAVLPFALALAGGTMVCVITDEIIPETHGGKNKIPVSIAFLLGFSFMLAMDYYI